LLRAARPWWYVEMIKPEADGFIVGFFPKSLRRWFPAEQWGPPLLRLHLVHPLVHPLPIGPTQLKDALAHNVHVQSYHKPKPVRVGDKMQDNGRLDRNWRPFGIAIKVEKGRCLLDFGDSLGDDRKPTEWRPFCDLITGVGIGQIRLGERLDSKELISTIRRCWPKHDVDVTVTGGGSVSAAAFRRTRTPNKTTVLSAAPDETLHFARGHLPKWPDVPASVCRAEATITVDGEETPVYINRSDATPVYINRSRRSDAPGIWW